jgi:hypothetical protein
MAKEIRHITRRYTPLGRLVIGAFIVTLAVVAVTILIMVPSRFGFGG